MKKISLEEVRAARESLVKLGLVRQIGIRNGQPVWGAVSPDDFRCPACGGDWAGIQSRLCQSCSEVAAIERSISPR
jgi:hypothetical protein